MLVYSRGYLVPSRKVAIVRHVARSTGERGEAMLRTKDNMDLFHKIALEEYIGNYIHN